MCDSPNCDWLVFAFWKKSDNECFPGGEEVTWIKTDRPGGFTCSPSVLSEFLGLIIDAFGELRDQQEQVKEDMEVKTYTHTHTIVLYRTSCMTGIKYQYMTIHSWYCYNNQHFYVSLSDQMFYLWYWQRLLRHSATWLWNAHATGAQLSQLPVSTSSVSGRHTCLFLFLVLHGAESLKKTSNSSAQEEFGLFKSKKVCWFSNMTSVKILKT